MCQKKVWAMLKKRKEKKKKISMLKSIGEKMHAKEHEENRKEIKRKK
jgi:hypothetical protein